VDEGAVRKREAKVLVAGPFAPEGQFHDLRELLLGDSAFKKAALVLGEHAGVEGGLLRLPFEFP
jgi:hypothetical protein